MREIENRDAIKEAIAEEMQADENVFLMGEDVASYNGAFKCSQGLLERFGPKRVVDTPIAENGFVGLGIGAAMSGLRPIVELMTFDFSLVAIDQIINTAAKTHLMSGGSVKVPIVFRGANGAAQGHGAQHSCSYEHFYASTPGLKVVAPATPYDMKGLLKSAIRDDNPVVFFESELSYGLRGGVPEEEYTVEIGKADLKREGTDLTIISWSKNVFLALEVAEALAEENISADVLDLRTLRPLDKEAIFDSVKKTHKVAIIQEQHEVASFGSYISHLISTQIFDELDAPVCLVSSLEAPLPYAKSLEAAILPSRDRCLETIRAMS